jgi:hypothetical protein
MMPSKKRAGLTGVLGFLVLLNAGPIFAAEDGKSLSDIGTKTELTTESKERAPTGLLKLSLTKPSVDSAQSNIERCKEYCPLANGRPTTRSLSMTK